MARKLHIVLFSSVFLSAGSLAQGAALMLDFGSSPGLVDAANAANSPGHAVGAIPTSEITWNQLTTSDVSSGLLYSDATSASGIAVNIGQETTIGSNIIDFASANSINASSLGGNAAVALGTDYAIDANNKTAAADGIFRNGTSNGTNAAMGLRIDGLAAGTYTIYSVGRNTNTGSATPQIFFASAATLSDNFDYAGLDGVTSANSLGTGNDSWTAGEQYTALSVTLTAGQSLFLATEGTTATERRGFLNAVQIAVPEPTTLTLFGLAAGMLTLRRRR